MTPKTPGEVVEKLLSEYGRLEIMKLIRYMRDYGIREAQTRLTVDEMVREGRLDYTNGLVKLRRA